MADKLKISKSAAEKLNTLSIRLNLKRNVVCRIAISISLSTETPVSDKIESDNEGYEFNKSTIFGPDEILFRSVAAFVQKKHADSNQFNVIIRNHLERGLDMMANDYEKINSPVGYLTSLVKDT